MTPRIVPIFFFLALSFLPTPLPADVLSYKPIFLGLKDTKVLREIEKNSNLVILRKKPPASVNALRYRTQSDIPTMLKILHANSYYDAYITSDIEEEEGSLLVYVFIHPGPKYILDSYQIFLENCKEVLCLKTEKISLSRLGVTLEKPNQAETLLHSRTLLLKELACRGYPLASIQKENFVADVAKKTLQVDLCLDKGALCRFGPLILEGLKKVDLAFVLDKILWKEGEIYSENLVENTQNNLIATDLFSSVLISHPEKPDKEGNLPIKMRFTELKPRSLSLGVSYATINGPGVNFGWTHRNFLGKGQQIILDGFYAKVYSQGSLSYKIPDFIRVNQDLLSKVELSREHITVYTSLDYELLSQVERKWGNRHFLTLGIKAEHLIVKESIQNEKTDLLGLPFFWRYSRVKNLLDPTEGFIASYKSTYYHKLFEKPSGFYKETLWLSGYIPIQKKGKLVLALKTQFGSLLGSPLRGIPLPKRFFGGSDNDLRGFKFKTVSPLNEKENPEGGKSYLLNSVELRYRISESFGCIGFCDLGTVTASSYPNPFSLWYKSAGVGVRYFTFFGPLRMDIGFPINPRHIGGKLFDPHFRVYVSIGQTF